MENNVKIHKDGYVVVNFKNMELIDAIQDQIKSIFASDPTELHLKKIEDADRLKMIKKAKDSFTTSDLVRDLLISNAECFTSLLGPDVDIQTGVYLRVSRPNLEGDLIDWHRDTFYGNTPWEMNFWFPVFPLAKGAGLMVLEGSHLSPVTNVHYIEENDPFRKQVTKGSIASELGYQYAPKCDDTIANMDLSKVKLLTPEVGQAVFFFGHIVHRAQNLSNKTRVTIDVRIKHMLAPTSTKSGYYQPLMRGDIAQCIEKMHLSEEEVLHGN